MYVRISREEVPEPPKEAVRATDGKFSVYDYEHSRWRFARNPYRLVRFIRYGSPRPDGTPSIEAMWSE